MRFKLLILLSFAFTSLYGQQKTLKEKYISLGISPLSLVEPKTSTLESVLEIKPLKHFALELKYGFPMGITPANNSIRLNETYHELKGGIKYWPYFDFLFVGLEYFHVNHQYDRENSYFYGTSETIAFETAKISRKINGGRLRVGANHNFKSGLTIEGYFGIGMRNVDIVYHLVTGGQTIPPPFEEWFFPHHKVMGNKNKFDYYFGGKISYRLFRW